MFVFFVFVLVLAVKGHSHQGYFPITKQARIASEFDNGYAESRFNHVLDTFLQEFSAEVAAEQGQLIIQRDWSDGAVNAWAWKIGSEFILEVPGGIARYSRLNEAAFFAVLCHEYGHLMGGAPHSFQVSYEGQSDYYSTSRCMARLLSVVPLLKTEMPSPEVTELCSSSSCQQTLIGAVKLTGYYAFLLNQPAPQLSLRDETLVERTLQPHPSPQCRLDTLKAGLFCPVTGPVSWTDWRQGYCHSERHPAFARPRCWFAER